ncbi:MAG: hypothetical protein WCN98_00600 [Verrucomicrobiaceae bacterium]
MKPTTQKLILLGGILAAFNLSSCGPAGGDKKEDAKPAAAQGGSSSASVPAGDLEDVTPKYPKPMFVGTPIPTGNISNLEKPDPEAVKARLTFKVAKGSTNIAKGKKITGSDSQPIIGTLDLITDDDLDGADGSYVELAPGTQWVQIDLGETSVLSKVLVWHFHKQSVVYFGVVVQVSDDPEFKTGVTTIFNNDLDDKCKQGKGTDKNYVETNHGRLIDGKNAKGRYVRLWSAGNSANEMNHYVEVQVYGKAAK